MRTVFQAAFSVAAAGSFACLTYWLANRLAPRKPDPVRAEAERGVAELEEYLKEMIKP